jgi:hypothetical protein
MLFLFLAYLRAAGLLPKKPVPDPAPEDGGFVSIGAGAAAAHAYVDAQPVDSIWKVGKHLLIDAASTAAGMGRLDFVVSA